MTLLISRILITAIVIGVVYYVLVRVWTREVDLFSNYGKPSATVPIKGKNTEPTGIMELEEPSPSEVLSKIIFSLGGGGIPFIADVSKLKEHPIEPFNVRGFKPIEIYISNDKIYADALLYGGSNLPPIQIKRNKLIDKPFDWDFNSNRNALEVVNEKQIPIYQFIYKTPSHIIFNGIFSFSGGLILASEKGVALSPSLPTTFELRRIFKYPSWQYPGQYEKKDADNSANPRSRPAA